MIATGVVTPFFVPVKVTMMVAFVFAAAWVLYQAWAHRARWAAHEKRLALPLVLGGTLLSCSAWPSAISSCSARCSSSSPNLPPRASSRRRTSQYLSFMSMFIAFSITFEVPVAVILMVKAGIVDVAKRASRPT